MPTIAKIRSGERRRNASSFSVCLVILCGYILRQGDAIRCSVCDSNDASSDCLTNPPAPQLCDGFDYCIAVAKYHPNGLLQSFTRTCSPLSLPETCVPTVDKTSKKPLVFCYTTCAKDGCNGSSSLHRVLDLLRKRRR